MSEEKKCPVCQGNLKNLNGKFRFDTPIEQTKNFSTPMFVYVCVDCGNMQHFVDVREIKPLL
jgi:hypothetical protein